MKISSRLAKSRHGVYYYRLQFVAESKRKERRFSLNTKSPSIAKAKALQISAIISRGKFSLLDKAMAYDPKNPLDVLARIKSGGGHQEFDIELPDGRAIRNIKPNEVDSALVAYDRMLSHSIESIGVIQQRPLDKTNLSSTATAQIEGGATVEETIQRYATRKNGKLKEKTQYEYGNNQRKFAEWIARRKSNKAFPIRMVTREDIAAFIDDLKEQKLSNRTIQHKYLAALGGLFEIAQSSGTYPKGDNPARGHQVFTKGDQTKIKSKTQYRPFTDDELKKIFAPENLLACPKPDDYWLPMLGLFTGGRIEELCQLAISDIQLIKNACSPTVPEDELLQKDLWIISINDENYKSVKTEAARREIPIHPQLIQLGFLDYVEDAKRLGTMLFPVSAP